MFLLLLNLFGLVVALAAQGDSLPESSCPIIFDSESGTAPRSISADCLTFSYALHYHDEDLHLRVDCNDSEEIYMGIGNLHCVNGVYSDCMATSTAECFTKDFRIRLGINNIERDVEYLVLAFRRVKVANGEGEGVRMKPTIRVTLPRDLNAYCQAIKYKCRNSLNKDELYIRTFSDARLVASMIMNKNESIIEATKEVEFVPFPVEIKPLKKSFAKNYRFHIIVATCSVLGLSAVGGLLFYIYRRRFGRMDF